MKIGLYLTEGKPVYYELAAICLESIRRTMPGVWVCQFTDKTSPALAGIDGAVRIPMKALPLMRSEHFARVSGEWLFVDTDVVFQRDVCHVFHCDFDIALADRRWFHARMPNLEATMPYNAGVIFSRQPQFWAEVHRRLLEQSGPLDAWYGDQQMIADVVRTMNFNILTLPGMIYNYPPVGANDPADHAAIVHCKGDRKQWMLSKSLSATTAVNPSRSMSPRIVS